MKKNKILFLNAAFLLIAVVVGLKLKNLSSAQRPIQSSVVIANTNNDFIENVLKKYPKLFNKVLSNVEEYQLQIIYTQINRDKNNHPTFQQFDYGLDVKKYFYPASLVKLPSTALALEKLNELKIKGLDKNSRMQTDSAWKCQKFTKEDTTAKNKMPSIAQYIKRMMLVSDNDAYSRIYEFLGQEYINNKLHEKGYNNAYLLHRFDGACNTEANHYTNPVSFFDSSGNLLYSQALQYNSQTYGHPLGIVKKGKGYIDVKNKKIMQPKDYTYANFLPLQEINDILRSIIFPESVPEKQRFHLTDNDRNFLLRYMSMYPRESDYPRYNVKYFEDSYKKYFIYGTWHKKIDVDTFRIFNIVGQSYGYLSDCAYICDFKNNVEFILSAVIYVNSDGIINDGKYEYNSIGFPFLSDLGKVIHSYELSRKKDFAPDLAVFRMKY